MVITFPPLPPDFPLMQHYSFLETYTPLFIWEQWVKTDTSSDIRINVYNFQPSDPPNWSLFRFPQHEMTKSIALPPWMEC